MYDSNFAFLIVGASFMKGSRTKFRPSRICLPEMLAVDFLKKLLWIFTETFELSRPRSNGILCFLNSSFKYLKSKSMTFQPVIMSGSISMISCLNFSRHFCSLMQISVFCNFTEEVATRKFFLWFSVDIPMQYSPSGPASMSIDASFSFPLNSFACEISGLKNTLSTLDSDSSNESPSISMFPKRLLSIRNL